MRVIKATAISTDKKTFGFGQTSWGLWPRLYLAAFLFSADKISCSIYVSMKSSLKRHFWSWCETDKKEFE